MSGTAPACASTAAEGVLEIELIAGNLSFPTSLTFDDRGVAFIAESGLAFGNAPPGGRIWELGHGKPRRLIKDSLRPPVNGLVWHEGWFYVSEGGHPARISRIDRSGRQEPILENLPGPGNYHTNTVAIGPDRKLYFSQGAMTNTGVIGLDSCEIGWLGRIPHACDLPGHELLLTGCNFDTPNPLSAESSARAQTGAFAPFATRTKPGQRIAPQLPCTAAVMRCDLDGKGLELVAWGLRNAYGLGFLPDGRLLATDQGADDRGSRPVANSPDLLVQVRSGRWYGWPDFIGCEPITDPQFLPERGAPPQFLLANHEDLPPLEPPLLAFPSHAGAVKFDIVPENVPCWGGQLLVALFGDERPMVAPPGPRAGRSLARIDPGDWTLHHFFTGPLRRPIDVKYNPDERSVYVLDFGCFEIDEHKRVQAESRSGALWKLPLG